MVRATLKPAEADTLGRLMSTLTELATELETVDEALTARVRSVMEQARATLGESPAANVADVEPYGVPELFPRSDEEKRKDAARLGVHADWAWRSRQEGEG